MTGKQQKAIAMLVDGHKMMKVAAEVGVNESTLYRWRHENEAFEAELDRQLDDVLDAARRALKRSALSAVSTLRDAMNGKRSAAAVKAADSILDRTGFKPQDKVSLDGELDANVASGKGPIEVTFVESPNTGKPIEQIHQEALDQSSEAGEDDVD